MVLGERRAKHGNVALPDEDEGAVEGVGFTLAVGKPDIPDISSGGLAGIIKDAVPTLLRVLRGVDFQSAPVEDPDRETGGRYEEVSPKPVVVAIVIRGEGIGNVDVVVALDKPDGLLGLSGTAGVRNGHRVG